MSDTAAAPYDINVQYQGFSPEAQAKTYISDLLQQIYDESPYSSCMRVSVARVSNSFKAVVRINSAAGRFFAIATGPQLKDVGHAIVGRLRRQLERWKERRFIGEC